MCQIEYAQGSGSGTLHHRKYEHMLPSRRRCRRANSHIRQPCIPVRAYKNFSLTPYSVSLSVAIRDAYAKGRKSDRTRSSQSTCSMMVRDREGNADRAMRVFDPTQKEEKDEMVSSCVCPSLLQKLRMPHHEREVARGVIWCWWMICSSKCASRTTSFGGREGGLQRSCGVVVVED